jgi:glyoxylase I family protein
MTEHLAYTPSHFALCVTDLERSLRFYCDGLGFEPAERYDLDDGTAPLLEVEGPIDLVAQFVRRDGMAIELLHYSSPGTHGRPSATRNQLGFTHLSFDVEDLEAATKHLEACGGRRIPSAHLVSPGSEIRFLEDPDGNRVELMQRAR